MNSNSSNNNIKNQVETKHISFNDKKLIVQGFLKIKQTRGNPNIPPEKKFEEKNKNISNEIEKKDKDKEKENVKEEKKEKEIKEEKEEKKEKEEKTEKEEKEEKKEKEEKDEKKEKEEKNDFCNGFDIIGETEINSVKNIDFENIDFKNIDIDNDFSSPFSKCSTNVSKKISINLWDIIPISYSIKKNTKNDIMKNIVSNIVYNGMFKDKLNEATKKSIILFDKIENNCNKNLLKKIKNSFIYMSYRSGLINTSFLPGNKNDYTSDCGWGCMLRCSQMMLSRGLIMKRIYDLKKKKPNKEIDMNNLRKEILILFYDKFINLDNMATNEEIGEIYKKLLKDKIEVAELIPPYSIYILTLLGECPNVFTSDNNMISCFIKINKTLFNEYIKILHFKDGIVYKQKLFNTFCKIVDSEKEDITNEQYIEYNSEKYIFNKGGIIFISLRLGLHQIESNFVKMIPKIFVNLHNNIGFISGKKKRAFYFIGMKGDKLIFADPHFNQKIEEDEKNFPTYTVNDLFLMSIKELSSQITIGVGLNCKEELEQFILDMQWLSQICQGLIVYKE